MGPNNEEPINTPDNNETNLNIESNGNTITFPRLNNNTNIRQYYDQQHNSFENKGAISDVKSPNNIRILSINPNGCSPNNQPKMVMMKEAIEKYQLDVILMNETNTKWNAVNVSRIEKKMRSIDRENCTFTADSQEWKMTNSDYLPGGVMSVFFSKCSPLIDRKKVKIGRLGNWMAVPLQYKNKRIEIINLYRIPSSSAHGIYCSLTQYNRIDGAMNTSTKYRKELLHDILTYVKENPEINDIIIGGDLNQYLNDNEIRKFQEELDVYEIHTIVNQVPIPSMGKTHKHGSKPIDSLAATKGIIDFIDGCKVLEYNDIVETDHRSYVIELALEDYFNEELSEWDKINKVMLNPARRSHRDKFVTELDKQLDLYNVEADLDRLELSCINEELEIVDKLITKILRKSTTKVEGMARGIPYSLEKEKRRCRVLYYKMAIREYKGKVIDYDLKNARRRTAVVVIEPTNLEEAETGLQIARELWIEIIERGKEFREKELLDYHPVEVNEEGEKATKKKKKIMAGIRRKLRRDHTFHYLSRHVGKGIRNGIKRLHIKNDSGEITETLIRREEIEQAIIKHNTQHLKKAHQTIAYKDKIYGKLKHDYIRNKIINGTLERSECDDERVYKFLKLLKRSSSKQYNQNQREINIQDWIRVVKSSKRKSASSIFSKRTYAVYKCALGSDRMTSILVRFYNILVKNEYVLQRWLDILDTMLGKGKGMIIGLLRIITLIEADFQFIMRIFLREDLEELIEDDERFSKSNYGSRQNYSIESALLEKRIIFDNSMLSGNKTIYTITDLQSCYDRQLAEIGGILEESTGKDRKAMKLIAKALPILKHFVCTGFGVSSLYYGGREDRLAGTGQGNRFSGDVCRDSSCIIIRSIERKEVGMMLQSRIYDDKIQKVAVAFVDDNDMMSDGEEVGEKMKIITTEYNDLYTASGGYVEEAKSKYYAYQWVIKAGKKVIVNIEEKVEINSKELKRVDCKMNIKTLGMMIGPVLNWKSQFTEMVKKMKEAIGKLNKTEMITSTASLYYNMYLIKKVYFGCGIITITEQQEEILKKIYEPVILRKMGLSEKFPRAVLYSRQTALGVGLMSPKTIIDSLALKLYVGHQRYRSELSKMIRINEENARYFYGYSRQLADIEDNYWPETTTWSDEIYKALADRNLKIINCVNERENVSKNKTIMDHAICYVKEKKLPKSTIQAINHVRIYKKMILPCELVGFNGNQITKEARESLERSSVLWKIKFDEVKKPNTKLIEKWKNFTEWLKTQQIETIIDFDKFINTKYKISNDRQYVKEMKNSSYSYYKAGEMRYGRNYYEEIEEVEVSNWRKCIAEISPGGQFYIYSMFPPPESLTSNNQEMINVPFNDDIINSILEKKAYAATDASVKEGSMGGCWILEDLDKRFRKENIIYHKQWEDNSPGIAEVIVLLELLEMIDRKGKGITEGQIQIGFDNKQAYRKIMAPIKKTNVYAQESGSEIARIKDILKNIKFEVKLKLITKKDETPSQNRELRKLLEECDKKAGEARINVERNELSTNIKYYGNYALMNEGIFVSRDIKEIMRISDSRIHENRHGKQKLGYKYTFVDTEARNVFKAKEVTPSMVKCSHGFNHYGLRDSLINNNMTEEHCPRCNRLETWDHVIRCSTTIEMRKEFIKNLLMALLKERENVPVNEIMAMGEDILCYLEEGPEDEYETNQHYIGMKDLFRGYVIKNWKETDFNSRKYRRLNKVLVRQCVWYYNECWKDRNRVMHDESKQRERLKKWYEKEKNKAERSEYRQLNLYVERCKIDIENSTNETIKKWIMNLKHMERKVEKIPVNDIRRWMIM
jgi:hypothetical protein